MREPGHEADREGDGVGDRDRDRDDDDPIAENDYFYLQRRLPDGRINMQARSRALAHARLLRARLIAMSGLDAAGTWQLRGRYGFRPYCGSHRECGTIARAHPENGGPAGGLSGLLRAHARR